MREPDKSKNTAWRRMRSACAEFGRDRDGSALFYTTLSLPVLIGFAVLAIDGSRFMNLNSTLQHAADGLALAAAGELDRRPDACDRAERALENLVENDQMFGDLGAATITIDDVEWTFLSELPTDDSQPIPASMEVDPQDPCDADSAREARYIEVWVKPQNFTTLFPASFLGGSNTAATNAVAVAGFDAAVCDFMPLFICNPFENDPDFESIYEASEDPEVLGRQLQIRKIGPGGSVGPGNYGFLQPSTGPGASELKKMFGMSNPPACFLQNGVEVQTGAIAAVGPWVNTRFDLYEKGANTVKNNSEYRPALNVRKGYTHTGNACNAAVDEDEPVAMGLPRDDCFSSSTCPHLGGQMGDGEWNFDEYWDTNFSDSGVAKPLCGGSTCSNANPPSRHSTYLYELANGLVPHASAAGEIGTPMCQATSDDSVDRRLIYAAVINCIEHEDKLVGGSGGEIPVEAFVELFITEPVKNAANESSEDTNIHDVFWLELVKIVEPGNNNEVARDRVQLYR